MLTFAIAKDLPQVGEFGKTFWVKQMRLPSTGTARLETRYTIGLEDKSELMRWYSCRTCPRALRLHDGVDNFTVGMVVEQDVVI